MKKKITIRTLNEHIRLDLNQFHTFKSCDLKKTNLLAGVSILHARIIAEEELAIEELDGYDSEDEVKEQINNQNIEHVLQRVYHTIKYRLNMLIHIIVNNLGKNKKVKRIV